MSLSVGIRAIYWRTGSGKETSFRDKKKIKRLEHDGTKLDENGATAGWEREKYNIYQSVNERSQQRWTKLVSEENKQTKTPPEFLSPGGGCKGPYMHVRSRSLDTVRNLSMTRTIMYWLAGHRSSMGSYRGLSDESRAGSNRKASTKKVMIQTRGTQCKRWEHSYNPRRSSD
ncbi:hypothetical protein K435DRAFT_845518 [Dendrothele bispora CBS 962.96]|uniref:Uncharacterized protein n=1 Tax=Dendrothele bispora (strain CBS 962.96) TaxID=1314807 RepID=A0A4S8KTU9_DENBC|nr:hypothetical protein K435DRAFT_845518 [Dendrothele bispora CBS 962.96]